MTLILLSGIAMGFLIAAPVGPIGLLCIRRSMRGGRISGFVSGLGAATADTLFGAIAAFGLTAITNFLIAHRHSLQLIGGFFLLAIGVRILTAKPMDVPTERTETHHLPGAYGSTLILTLANPTTILTFIGCLTTFGVGVKIVHASQALMLVAGVFLGSSAWWLILSASSVWLSRRLNSHGLRSINIGSGILVIAFGLWQLLEYVLSL